MMEKIWNPWHGCIKYSEGCEHCYMYYLDAQRNRFGGDIYKVKSSFDLPLKCDRSGEYKIKSGESLMVCMTSDFFLEEADKWRDEVWDMIRRRPDVSFWLQTKRAERVRGCLPDDWGDGYENVRFCVTAENQARADERLPILLELPFKYKSVMCAPILSEIDISEYLASGEIKKVIADGENYDGRRPCRYEWIKSLSEQCRRYGIPFDFVGTGNVFIKNGKEYDICRAYHAVEARRSGLSYPPSGTDIKIQPRCAFCSKNQSCGGCRNCGKCDDTHYRHR